MTRDIHDAARLDTKCEVTFSRVMNATAILNKHQAEYNIYFKAR